jgi:phosphoribosylglycinamide formyltransferase 1
LPVGSVAVLASGSGSNFQAICEELAAGPHEAVGLLCDQPDARVLSRAEALAVPSVLVPYGRSANGGRRDAERRMESILHEWSPDLIVLAGFMRVLSPDFVTAFPRTIINIHPSLLPRHRGLGAIARSFTAGDEVVGITVHFVDHGVDTGEIIRQETLTRQKDETLANLQMRIHALEHQTYPEVILKMLDGLKESVTKAGTT